MAVHDDQGLSHQTGHGSQQEKLADIQKGLDALMPAGSGQARWGHLRNMTHLREQFGDEHLMGEVQDSGGNGNVKGTPTDMPPDSPAPPAI